MNAIEIKGLSKVFKAKKGSGFELKDIDLILPSGCIMGLVGENGAGKSTTIKLILETLNRDKGEIRILGHDSIRDCKEDVGIVMDEVGFPECLNSQQIGKIMKNIYKNWNSDIYSDYLKKFGLESPKRFGEYSKGMKMKLGMAVALSHDPKLLILDEATAGLDPVIRDDLLDIFTEFTRDESHSILISSHIVSDLEKVCDYIAFINNGRMMLCEEKDKLYEQYCVVHCSRENYDDIDKDAILGKKENPYGINAIVRRDAVPEHISVSPIDIEELFVFMVKGGRQ